MPIWIRASGMEGVKGTTLAGVNEEMPTIQTQVDLA